MGLLHTSGAAPDTSVLSGSESPIALRPRLHPGSCAQAETRIFTSPDLYAVRLLVGVARGGMASDRRRSIRVFACHSRFIFSPADGDFSACPAHVQGTAVCGYAPSGTLRRTHIRHRSRR